MKRLLVPVVFVLAACDASPPPPQSAERQPNPVFETQIQAVEKARGVEAQVMEAAQAQKKQIDEAAQ